MPYFDRMNVSKGIGVNKTSESKEDDKRYWYFLDETIGAMGVVIY